MTAMTTVTMTVTMTVEAMMTKGSPDRKLLQRVRSETEHNERLLGRTIATTLATCGTLVGWMMLSRSLPAAAAQSAEVVPTDIDTAVEWQAPAVPTLALVEIEYAPIPTLVPVAQAAPPPQLLPEPDMLAANAAPVTQAAQAAPVAQAAAPAADAAPVAAAPAMDAMPALRMVSQPAPPPVAPRPAAKPNPGGNTGGS